jgi:hypothetical protein
MSANDMALAANIYANGKNARRNATTMRTLVGFSLQQQANSGPEGFWTTSRAFHNNDGAYLDKLLG